MTDLAEKYREMHNVGFPIFEKLFNLKKPELLKVCSEIFYDNEQILEILKKDPLVLKSSRNDEPEEIVISFYSKITIAYYGVSYKPEHGPQKGVLKFDKFFNIDAALQCLS